MWESSADKCTLCKTWIHKQYSGVRDNLLFVVDGIMCNRCDGASLIKDLVMHGETYGSVIWETLLMDMVERCLLQQLESEMDGKKSDILAISHIQSSRSSVSQLRQKQHDLWK